MAKDRTAEFHNTLLSIKSRSVTPQNGSAGTRRDNEAKQSLLGNGVASGSKPKGKGKDEGGSKSEFGRLAAGIAKDINATTLKLQKLAQLAKRKTLFDDRPIEISELTYIIRQDIASLNTQIGSLQSYVRAQKEGKNGTKGGAAQVDEHNTNVVMLLQSRLANMGMGFKDVLELRTQNMKASKDRTEQFMHTTANSSVPPPSNSTSLPAESPRTVERELTPDSLLFSQPPAAGGPGTGFPSDRKGKARALPDDPDSKDFLALDLDGDRGENGQGQGGGYQQMQLVEQQNDYIQSRSTAIESIESTIAELGSIFSQLANMVAEQRETVQRIDADTTDIAANVSGAQRELLKYYASVTSNRWLMLKIFGVLIIFFLVFILVS